MAVSGPRYNNKPGSDKTGKACSTSPQHKDFFPRKLLSGKHILITGTTGFVGKVILEKIIREIPEVAGVYLLIRGNRQHPDAGSRFQHEILSSSVFDHLRIENPSRLEQFCRDKIHCVTGEVTEPMFSLATEEFVALGNQLDVIINSAASVNFREALDKALQINTFSLKQIMALSEVKRVPVVQVSTCYVNGYLKGAVTEQNNKPKQARLKQVDGSYYEVGDLIASMQQAIVDLKNRFVGDDLEKALIALGSEMAHRHGWNDTYTMTKWLGEQLLLKGMKQRHLTLFRPAIVESCLKSPSPGWVEGVKVADALILAYAREKVKFFPGRGRSVLDVIPVDLVANGILLAAAELIENQQQSSIQHHIYQCCSGSVNPVTVRQFADLVQQCGRQNYDRLERLFLREPRQPFRLAPKSVFLSAMASVKASLQFASRIGEVFGVAGKLAALENIKTAQELSRIFSFYSSASCIYHNEKLMQLHQRLDDADSEAFTVDPAEIDWQKYVSDIHIPGLHRYALRPRKVYQLKTKNRQSRAA